MQHLVAPSAAPFLSEARPTFREDASILICYASSIATALVLLGIEGQRLDQQLGCGQRRCACGQGLVVHAHPCTLACLPAGGGAGRVWPRACVTACPSVLGRLRSCCAAWGCGGPVRQLGAHAHCTEPECTAATTHEMGRMCTILTGLEWQLLG